MRNDDFNQNEGEQDDESIYDEFADFTFNVDWVQKIWDITGHLWYHEESLAFLEPVKKSDLGDKVYRYYLSVIAYPMDLTTIKERIKQGYYQNPNQWRQDVETMFKNCLTFNDDDSEIY